MSFMRSFASQVVRNYNNRILNVERVTNWSTMSSFQLRSLSDLNVKHNSQKNQFFVELGSDKAVLEYKEVKPGLLDLYHTEVPNQLRGKGIAQMLAKEAFDYMVKNNIKMIVSCTYLQKYLKDNPNEEYTKQVFENKH